MPTQTLAEKRSDRLAFLAATKPLPMQDWSMLLDVRSNRDYTNATVTRWSWNDAIDRDLLGHYAHPLMRQRYDLLVTVTPPNTDITTPEDPALTSVRDAGRAATERTFQKPYAQVIADAKADFAKQWNGKAFRRFEVNT